VATKLNWYGLVTLSFVALLGLVTISGASLGDKFWGLLVLGAVGFSLFLHRRANAKAARAAEVASAGTRGVATVVSIAPGSSVVAETELLFRLQLEMPGAEPRQVDLAEEVTDYAASGIAQGMRLPVIVDSADPDRVVLVW